MKESDWLNATDPQSMLLFLRNSGKATDRKLRLFAAACCRRVWHLLADERSRRAIEVLERFADGGEGGDARSDAYLGAWDAAKDANGDEAVTTASFDAADAVYGATLEVAADAADYTSDSLTRSAKEDAEGVTSVGGGEQSALLRDIFGPLPFRPVTLPPSVRTWNDGTIVTLAEAAYRERQLPSGELDRQRFAVLADALEEVGADDLLLEHLRGPGPRVRGCFVIDMLTGRE